jgi:hypothetical protein
MRMRLVFFGRARHSVRAVFFDRDSRLARLRRGYSATGAKTQRQIFSFKDISKELWRQACRLHSIKPSSRHGCHYRAAQTTPSIAWRIEHPPSRKAKARQADR